MKTLSLLLALAACGGSSKPAAEPTPPATSSLLDCGKVADHVATTVAAAKPRATPAAVKDMVNTRCSTDAWTDETKQCLFAIKTIEEGRGCATTMTDEQREAMKNSARALRAANASPEPEPSEDWIRHVVEEPPPPKT